ncbi:regulator of G-protein signaling 21 [Esox lucius]|uniref:RGS domain-containing protein n=1 Tax=Esox lucius TaxID=8010 RepID=A0A3P8XF50_ESOLU|nr:regulator of G-protein signaling 21 [Esox lucius]
MVFGCRAASEDTENAKGLLHKPWKSRLHNFIHTPLPHTRKKVHIQSSDGLKQLGQSLENLLTHKYGKAAFRDFLQSQFCEENLEFWQACEEFKSISNPMELACKATSIYKEFIQTDSPKEVNVDFHTRDTIAQNLQRPTPSCFDGAQKKVYSLMENDAYPRFIQSDYFKELYVGSRGLGKHRRA